MTPILEAITEAVRQAVRSLETHQLTGLSVTLVDGPVIHVHGTLRRAAGWRPVWLRVSLKSDGRLLILSSLNGLPRYHQSSDPVADLVGIVLAEVGELARVEPCQ